MSELHETRDLPSDVTKIMVATTNFPLTSERYTCLVQQEAAVTGSFIPVRTHCVGPACSFNIPLMTMFFQKSWKLPSLRESFRRSRATAGRVCSFFTEWAAIFNTSVNLPDNMT